MHEAPLETLAASAASEIWNWIPEIEYDRKTDLIDDILGLIFRVQAESLAAADSYLIYWTHEIQVAPSSYLVCEVEQIAGGPQRFVLYYSDPYDDFLPLREWEDSGGAAVLRELAE